MPDYTDGAKEFCRSTQAKLEEIKKDFLKVSPKCKDKNVIIILDIKVKSLNLLRFDA